MFGKTDWFLRTDKDMWNDGPPIFNGLERHIRFDQVMQIIKLLRKLTLYAF